MSAKARIVANLKPCGALRDMRTSPTGQPQACPGHDGELVRPEICPCYRHPCCRPPPLAPSRHGAL